MQARVLAARKRHFCHQPTNGAPRGMVGGLRNSTASGPIVVTCVMYSPDLA